MSTRQGYLESPCQREHLELQESERVSPDNFSGGEQGRHKVRLESKGHIAHRITAQGYSDYVYADGTDWLSREFWHPISRTITGTFDLVRYWYANGRPGRVELPIVKSTY